MANFKQINVASNPDVSTVMQQIGRLLVAGFVQITAYDINTIELQDGTETLRFERVGSEQEVGEFDQLLELVGKYSNLAARGVSIPRRIVK